MPEKLTHTSLVKAGNTLIITFLGYSGKTNFQISDEFQVNNSTVFQAQVFSSYWCINKNHNYATMIFVRFYKRKPIVDKQPYTIKCSSQELSVSNKCFTSNDDTWHLIYQTQVQKSFTISIVLNDEEENEVPRCERIHAEDNVISFASLHEDEDLTDFELRGEDGVVRFHRAVLAVVSPVLYRMLCGAWKETMEGHVNVPGTSKHTLQSLKDYVYLRTLPAVGLEQLLLLASIYIMPDLEQKCIDKLAQSLTAQNTSYLLKFSVKNKVHKLTIMILEAVKKNKDLKIEDIRQHAQSETDSECEG